MLASMPYYFFNVHRDDRVVIDTVGSAHANLAEVRREAVETTWELLYGQPIDGSNDLSWQINVTDEAGAIVLTLSIVASVAEIAAPSP
jgi:hypothetical protein